jgi:ribosomal protein L7Ae-like RNA K-turn-binding protein
MDLEAEKKVISLLQFAYRSGKLKFGLKIYINLKESTF